MNYTITVVFPFNVQLSFTISQETKENFIEWFKDDDQEKFYLVDINNNVNFINKNYVYAIKIVSEGG